MSIILILVLRFRWLFTFSFSCSFPVYLFIFVCSMVRRCHCQIQSAVSTFFSFLLCIDFCWWYFVSVVSLIVQNFSHLFRYMINTYTSCSCTKYKQSATTKHNNITKLFAFSLFNSIISYLIRAKVCRLLLRATRAKKYIIVFFPFSYSFMIFWLTVVVIGCRFSFHLIVTQ